MRRTSTLILGGGPAGSAAAITLARAGHRPLLIERQLETGDAICGGFLSWHSLAIVNRLDVRLNGAVVEELRMFTRSGASKTRLPAPALGVSRRQLDTVLLSTAERMGAQVERGVLAREADGPSVHVDGQTFAPERLLLATGKHDLRGLARPRPGHDPALGLRVRLGPSPKLTRLIHGAIELHLFDRGYAGLVLQEDGAANLCLAVRKSRLKEAGTPLSLLHAVGIEVPALGERLAWLDDDAALDAIASVPYGWRAKGTEDGIYRLGDQAAVIPSLAGEGMGIALSSGILGAEAVVAGRSPQSFQSQLARRTLRPVAIARAVLAAAERPCLAPALTGLAPMFGNLVARATRMSH